MNVRSVGVGRVGVCMMCTCVSEEGGGEKSADSEDQTISVVIHTWILQSHGLGQTVARLTRTRASDVTTRPDVSLTIISTRATQCIRGV